MVLLTVFMSKLFEFGTGNAILVYLLGLLFCIGPFRSSDCFTTLSDVPSGTEFARAPS